MIREVEQQRLVVAELCRRYRVRQLRLFGSAATGAFAPATSDLVFVAALASPAYKVEIAAWASRARRLDKSVFLSYNMTDQTVI